MIDTPFICLCWCRECDLDVIPWELIFFGTGGGRVEVYESGGGGLGGGEGGALLSSC